MTLAPDPRLIAVARGDEPADLVIAGARVLCVFTREWLDVDVAIAGERIAGFAERGSYHARATYDAAGRYLVPGYIDAHVHVESSKLMVDEFARVILAHGTTTIVSDPHEIANVLGTDGIHWLLDCCDEVPVDVFVMAPSCVPASRFESPRRPFSRGDQASILRRRRALGIAEMMNYPGVVAGDPEELAKLHQPDASHADGHAPGVAGLDLNAYLAAGIRTDHEATTGAEALERRRKGAWVLLREASNASNVRALSAVVRAHGPEGCAFCTDDREPDDLVADGQIDLCCRIAVSTGVRAEDALVMATLHGARAHGLTDRGAVAPGMLADLALLDDLVSFTPRDVWKSGRQLVSDGAVRTTARIEAPSWARRTVHVAPVGLSDLRIHHEGGRIRVIGTIPAQLLTEHLLEEPTVRDGLVVADPGRDLAKIAVVERHQASGRIGVGFVRGFGLKRGAFATTVAHDAHNIVVVGSSDEDMAIAVSRLAELGGGIVAVESARVRGELALPIAGLLSDAPAAEVVSRLGALRDVLRDLGVTDPSPFMTASFLALSVIPSLKITDRGLVDVDRFQLVHLHEGRPDGAGEPEARDAAETR